MAGKPEKRELPADAAAGRRKSEVKPRERVPEPKAGKGANPGKGTEAGNGATTGRGAEAGNRAKPGKGGTISWKKDPGGRRQRVLDEATRLFSQRGYTVVSTGDIARAAGVAEGSVFHYFGSKQELLRAVGERYGGEFAAAMFSGVEPVASPATVVQVVTRAFDFVARSWPGFGLFLLSDGPSAAPLAQKANREVVTRAVSGVLEAWGEQRVMPRVDAQVVAELLFGLVEAALKACFTGNATIARERYETETVTAISRILRIDGGVDRDVVP
jgi:AcrR family transcriptional regulator